MSLLVSGSHPLVSFRSSPKRIRQDAGTRKGQEAFGFCEPGTLAGFSGICQSVLVMLCFLSTLKSRNGFMAGHLFRMLFLLCGTRFPHRPCFVKTRLIGGGEDLPRDGNAPKRQGRKARLFETSERRKTSGRTRTLLSGPRPA